MTSDGSKQAVQSKCEAVKASTRLDPGHCDKVADYSGHNSAPYGEGGPQAAGPSSKGPGTTG